MRLPEPFQGTYKFHEHAKDEMYVVLEGEILSTTTTAQRSRAPGEILVVKAGERHRSARGGLAGADVQGAHLFAE